AEIASPLPDTTPTDHSKTGFVVTLWQRLEAIDPPELPAEELAESLRRLHAALAKTSHELPSFRTGLARARVALDNDTFMVGLPAEDRVFLRETYDDGLGRLD